MKKSDRRQAESDLFDTAENVPNFNTQFKFPDTNNPRYLRVLHALLTRSRRREAIDRHPVHPGVYTPTAADRRKLARWLSKC